MANEQIKINDSEKRFWSALRDIFVGAEVEGISGYINLMRIKSRYFEKIRKILKGDIKEKIEEFTEAEAFEVVRGRKRMDFREELHYKLYGFFRRYFSESGSIYFNTTPFSEKIYEKVYTDKEDVSLFWKTHMLYYVKTDRIFRSMKVEVDGSNFFFDASKLELKKAWEKREIIYELDRVRKDETAVFDVYYSERGRKTKMNDIKRALKKNGIRIGEEILESAFRIFEKQSEVDYFINKNAKQFLREQFDLWLYQYVYSDESNFTERRIKQLKVLQEIAYKTIDFISQFEDELVRIWNKPKFALKSNYVITLDRIAEKKGGVELIGKILKHKHLKAQVKEWKGLGIINENFVPKRIFKNTPSGKTLKSDYKFLPIDTRYFKDLELDILGLFGGLDDELDGWLIKSENYQALNTILLKFGGKVQTIYIDPPFNKEQDADYFYNAKFKDATWITMLENRLQLARDILNPEGSIFVRCDYNGNWLVRPLMNKIFDTENFRNEIAINRTKKIFTGVKGYNVACDSLFFFSKSDKFFFAPQYKKRGKKQTWINAHSPGERKPPERIFFGKDRLPPKGRHWTFVQQTIDKMIEAGRIKIKEDTEYVDLQGNKIKGMPQYLTGEEELLDSNWTDIPGYTQTQGFSTENSEILLKRVIESTSNENDFVVDFFLGSGTTTAVAHKLGRKWLGVEMGEHFYTVVLPRMKRVVAYDKSGISRKKDVKEKYNENNAGGFFKYYELEQFEDTLRKVIYEDSEPFLKPDEDLYSQYIFMKDLKLLHALKIDYKNNRVKVNLSKLYSGIDVAETLSNLFGKRIKKITEGHVEFDDGRKVDAKKLDYEPIKSLIWWEA